jgi:hypothetical protein
VSPKAGGTASPGASLAPTPSSEVNDFMRLILPQSKA